MWRIGLHIGGIYTGVENRTAYVGARDIYRSIQVWRIGLHIGGIYTGVENRTAYVGGIYTGLYRCGE